MHITSGLSPASGEMLDSSTNLYGDSGEQCGFFSLDNTVPESSHTVEIEYVYEQPDNYEFDSVNGATVCEAQSAGPAEEEKSQPKKTCGKKTVKIPHDEQETDLTNLTWLQNITNIMAVPQFPISPMSPNPPAKTQPQNTRLQKFNQTIAKCQKDFTEHREDYQKNSDKKPPYSYSTLICMAMRYNNDKMTLSAIYSWIRENFKYYRNADPTWQVSFIFSSLGMVYKIYASTYQ